MNGDTEIVHAQVSYRRVKKEGYTQYQLMLVDYETGEPIFHDRVKKLFQNDSITGVHVKPKPDASFDGVRAPGFARITDIEKDYIVLDGEWRIKRSKFHELYQLD